MATDGDIDLVRWKINELKYNINDKGSASLLDGNANSTSYFIIWSPFFIATISLLNTLLLGS